MRILHLCFSCIYPDKFAYQENILPRINHEELADGIQKTIEWYLNNRSGEYQNYYERMYGNR